MNSSDVRMIYRHLVYGQDDDKMLQKIELGGFGVGANFRIQIEGNWQ